MKEMYNRMVDAVTSYDGGTFMMVVFIVVMALLLGPIVEIFG